jgi:hypothetical protein
MRVFPTIMNGSTNPDLWKLSVRFAMLCPLPDRNPV